MDDRRDSYRHVLASRRRLSAELHVAGGRNLRGVIIDFSVGGLSVQMPRSPVEEPLEETWFISFSLSSSEKPLVLTAELVHLRATDPPVAGFRFLPLLDYKTQTEVEKRIWSYLLNEQRLSLRRTG
jgi:PilZ domain